MNIICYRNIYCIQRFLQLDKNGTQSVIADVAHDEEEYCGEQARFSSKNQTVLLNCYPNGLIYIFRFGFTSNESRDSFLIQKGRVLYRFNKGIKRNLEVFFGPIKMCLIKSWPFVLVDRGYLTGIDVHSDSAGRWKFSR